VTGGEGFFMRRGIVDIITEEDIPGAQNGYPEDPPDYKVIFGAPDLSTFFKKKPSQVQKEYEQRAASFLKAGFIGALNTNNLADAAAILTLGPGLAQATGTLADADERAKKMIDMITAPNNPLVMFALTAIPLISQLARNHEPQLANIPNVRRTRRAEKKAAKASGQPYVKPEPKFTVHLPFGRKIGIRFTSKIKLGKLLAGFKAQTTDPRDLTFHVFTDQHILKALKDQGINIQPANTDEASEY
jgi:hypothetical protein